MKAAVYARVSTLDQEPENQLAELRRYVEARGWSAVEFVDRGVSGGFGAASEPHDRAARRRCPPGPGERLVDLYVAPLPERPPSPAPSPEAPAPVAIVSPQEREFRKKLKELRDHLTKNADYVGQKFPQEARKMHYGEIEHRSIYGEATPDQAKELHEEGIEFHPLPVLPDERN